MARPSVAQSALPRCSGAPLLALLVVLLAVALACGGRATGHRADNPAPPAAAAPGAANRDGAAPAGCTAFLQGAESTGAPNQDAVLCTFRDAAGREVQLTAGRSSRGRDRGDWGWAHIRDKHIYNRWEGGGPNTLFGEVGAGSEPEVIDLIRRTLAEDPQPRTSADGRREYRLPVAGTGYAVLVVVGESGRIITAYPVREARR